MLNGENITMNQNLIAYYIDQLTEADAMKLAKQYNVNVTNQEIKVILPFLKKNRYRINKQNKNALLNEAQKILSPETYKKAVITIDKFLK